MSPSDWIVFLQGQISTYLTIMLGTLATIFVIILTLTQISINTGDLDFISTNGRMPSTTDLAFEFGVTLIVMILIIVFMVKPKATLCGKIVKGELTNPQEILREYEEINKMFIFKKNSKKKLGINILFNWKNILNEVAWISSSILTSIVFYYLFVTPNLSYPLNLLWLILFLATYVPFLTIILLLFVMFHSTRKYYKPYKEFLKRMIPGITGGLTVLVATQFQSSLPSSPNVIDTVLPRLMSTAALVIIIFIMFSAMYVMVDRPKIKVLKPEKQGSPSKKPRKPRS